MAPMDPNQPKRPNQWGRLLREPTIHFFVLAAATFLVQSWWVGDPRIVVVTPVLKANLVRRLHDQLGRPPTTEEEAKNLRLWERDEALYREALREGLDRDDPMVRSLLIAKMRDREMLQAPIPAPTEADLQRYFEQHRDLFELPSIYEHEYIVLPKDEPGIEDKRAKYQTELNGGATPMALHLRSTAAKVERERIVQEFGEQAAESIVHLGIGKWHTLEAPGRLLLVRMISVEGGLPPPEVMQERLLAAWRGDVAQKAAEQATDRIAKRYRFEEPAR